MVVISKRYFNNFRAVGCHCAPINYSPSVKYFQDYRCQLRKKHPSFRENEDHHPAELSPNPVAVLNKINCSKDRYLDQLHLGLSNIDHRRQAELLRFIEVCIFYRYIFQLSKKHREYYLDRTGKNYPVPYFTIQDSPARRTQQKYGF